MLILKGETGRRDAFAAIERNRECPKAVATRIGIYHDQKAPTPPQP